MNSAPITSEDLLVQKDCLAHTEPVLATEAPLLVEEPLIAREEAVMMPTTNVLANDVEATLLMKEPTVFERIEKPTVVQERIHPVMKEEIQPVIYRGG